jgi:hypothetical protein
MVVDRDYLSDTAKRAMIIATTFVLTDSPPSSCTTRGLMPGSASSAACTSVAPASPFKVINCLWCKDEPTVGIDKAQQEVKPTSYSYIHHIGMPPLIRTHRLEMIFPLDAADRFQQGLAAPRQQRFSCCPNTHTNYIFLNHSNLTVAPISAGNFAFAIT